MTVSSLRAVARIGRRGALRRPGRTALVVALVALAVGLAVYAGIAARTLGGERDLRPAYGSAAAQATGYEAPPSVIAALDGEIAARLAPAEWHRYRSIGTRSAWRYLEVQDVDLGHPLTAGGLDVLAGRLPAGPDEVALTSELLDTFGVDVGDDLAVELATGTLEGRVVAELRDREWLDRTLAVVSPSSLDEMAGGALNIETVWLVGDVPGLETLLADLQAAWDRAGLAARSGPPVPVPPELTDLAAAYPDRFANLTAAEMDHLAALSQIADSETVLAEAEYIRSGSDFPLAIVDTSGVFAAGDDFIWDDPPVLSTLVATLLLIEVGLLAAAAYTTGMRRRLRDVGLLLANGATGRQVRMALAAEGALAGGLGALLGVAAGLAAGLASLPLFQLATNRLLEAVDIAPLDVAGPAAAGILAATAAAWWPARAAGKVAPTTALAGRMPLGRPPAWVVPVAIAATAVGLAILAAGRNAADNGSVLALLTGGIAAIGGAALLAVPIMGLAGNMAGRLPLLGRLAVRDASRQRTRAAAAIAAVMAIMLVPVTTAAALAADDRRADVWGLDPAADLVWMQRSHDDTGQVLAASPEELAIAQSIIPDARRVDVAVYPARATLEVPPAGVGGFEGVVAGEFAVAAASPELLDALGIERADEVLGAGTALVLGVTERERTVHIHAGGETVAVRAEERRVALPYLAPRVLVPPGLAASLELPEPGGATLFALDRDLTQQEYETLVDMPAGVSAGSPTPWVVRHLEPLAAGAALLLALVVIAMVLSLAATESDRDLRTMVAVGAEPRLRRGFLATQAGLFVLVAGLLAVPLGLMLLNALSDRDGFVTGPFGAVSEGGLAVPWPMVGLVVVVMPLVVAALTALVARSAPVGPLRRVD